MFLFGLIQPMTDLLNDLLDALIFTEKLLNHQLQIEMPYRH